MRIGVTLYNIVFIYVFDNKRNLFQSIIFSILSVSCPIIPYIFVFEMLTMELGFILIFTAFSIYNIFYYFKNQNKKYYLLSIISLTVSLGIYDSAMLFYVVGIANCFFLLLMREKNENRENEKELWKILKKIGITVSVLFFSLIVNSIITRILCFFLKVVPSDYKKGFYKNLFNILLNLRQHLQFININTKVILCCVLIILVLSIFSCELPPT